MRQHKRSIFKKRANVQPNANHGLRRFAARGSGSLRREIWFESDGVDELLADPGIDTVLNLTVPAAHSEINQRALEAGKNVHCEKPFGLDREDALRMLDFATKKKLRVGSAPDTFFGGGHQTCRKLIDEGLIGEVVSGTAFMLCHGHESWHPAPAFYYLKGGGPLFDMGRTTSPLW